MTLVKWQPRHQTPFFRLFNDFDKYFGQLDSYRAQTNHDQPTWFPAMDISETDKQFSIVADLPGLSKKDIDLNVTEDTLTISGERTMNKKSDDQECVRRELSYGKFSRSFSLPENIDKEEISAEFSRGVLVLNIPKIEPVHPPVKQIQIK